MAQAIPNGSQIAIATAITAPIAVTSATNATSTVLTTATNTYAVGDLVEVTLGWAGVTNRVFRVSGATATTVTLENMDTTATAQYPVGGGVGTIRKITTWTTLLQILEPQISGGDPESVDIQYLESRTKTKITTVFSAISIAWKFGDDISLPGYQSFRTASLSRAQTPIKITSLAGGLSLYTGTCNLNENPSLNLNEVIKVNATYDALGAVVRY